MVVTDLREELVAYVNGRPYLRRELEMPAAALHHAGQPCSLLRYKPCVKTQTALSLGCMSYLLTTSLTGSGQGGLPLPCEHWPRWPIMNVAVTALPNAVCNWAWWGRHPRSHAAVTGLFAHCAGGHCILLLMRIQCRRQWRLTIPCVWVLPMQRPSADSNSILGGPQKFHFMMKPGGHSFSMGFE